MKAVLILGTLLMAAGSVQAATLIDTFEGETAGNNPTDTWYSYQESGLNGGISGSGLNGSTRSFTVGSTGNDAGQYTQFVLNTATNASYVQYLYQCSGGANHPNFQNYYNQTGASIVFLAIYVQSGCTFTNNFCGSDFSVAASGTIVVRLEFNWTAHTYTLKLNGVTAATRTFCGGAGVNGPLKTLRVSEGNGGTGSSTIVIDNLTVQEEPIPPSIQSFTTNYRSTRQNGTILLSWEATADSCALTGVAGSLPVTAAGYAYTLDSPPGNFPLTLTCTTGYITDATAVLTIIVVEQLQIAGPNGVIFGGDRGALAEAAHVSETALSFLFGVLFMFIFGLIGMAAAGLNGGLGGALAGLIISLAIGILPVWFLFLIAAAFLLLLYSMSRGTSNGL